MSVIESRIAKLEQIAQGRQSPATTPGLTDGALANIRRIARTCNNWQELAAYLRSRLPAEDQGVVQLETKRREEAALCAAARTFFDEANSAAIIDPSTRAEIEPT
ncbi:MAG: hypothetical protein OSB00_06600 [Sphingomonas bacterium]|nr:hypothetical protein [Sphingomonas bacterium]